MVAGTHLKSVLSLPSGDPESNHIVFKDLMSGQTSRLLPGNPRPYLLTSEDLSKPQLPGPCPCRLPMSLTGCCRTISKESWKVMFETLGSFGLSSDPTAAQDLEPQVSTFLLSPVTGSSRPAYRACDRAVRILDPFLPKKNTKRMSKERIKGTCPQSWCYHLCNPHGNEWAAAGLGLCRLVRAGRHKRRTLTRSPTSPRRPWGPGRPGSPMLPFWPCELDKIAVSQQPEESSQEHSFPQITRTQWLKPYSNFTYLEATDTRSPRRTLWAKSPLKDQDMSGYHEIQGVPGRSRRLCDPGRQLYLHGRGC